jgi:DNA-binding NarL/FixJ family response regulator
VAAAEHRVRVLVVDDSAASRTAIADAVAHTCGFECVGAVASGRDALEVLPRLEPELVLLDVRMDGLNGVETCRLIRAGTTRPVVVLVSVLHSSELPEGAACCGADAILHKSEVSPRLLAGLWERLRSEDAGEDQHEATEPA